jgi:hypothetical protein
MKTVKPRGAGGVPERVSDAVAAKLVDSGGCLYCKKEEWKQQVRDAAKLEAEAAEKARKLKAEAVEKARKDGREINEHKNKPRKQ